MPIKPRWMVLGLLAWAASLGGAAEPTPGPFTPDPASVQRLGPAYRYPQAGWINLHIEGEPYERGQQHGRLMYAEIADYIKTLASYRSPKAPAEGWRDMRLLVNALFQRRYDREYLEEMKGIADGAAAAGAKFDGRAIDLLDIVSINSGIEVDFLDENLNATATGLEGARFKEPAYVKPRKLPPAHCSAFAATGPATADGKIVFGHITMWNLYHVRHFNVWIDIKPSKGQRILFQGFPGGIMSGLDYYMNDAGILVAETTIKQTSFDINGDSMVSRIRKTVQYSKSIDEVVAILGSKNNGVYSNEWLLADTKTNEIGLYELGTHKSKLWRSSKDDWLGGTRGFYWGCNNTKDIQVRLETVASVDGKPANMVFAPSDRDLAWLKLFAKHKGKIGPGFGFEAFTTPPLAAFPSCDAKFTTSALAKEMKTYGKFGPPLGRTWDPRPDEKEKYSDIVSLVGNDWALVSTQAPVGAKGDKSAAADLGGKLGNWSTYSPEDVGTLPPAWHGTILPRHDADIWLAAAFSDYEKIVALENSLKQDGHFGDSDRDRMAVAMFEPRSRYLTARQRWGKDEPLAKTKAMAGNDDWYLLASGKGVLLLAELRSKMGEDAFDKMMDDFGRSNAGKEVTAVQFQAYAEKAYGKPLAAVFDPWLTGKGMHSTMTKGYWSIVSFEKEPERSLIVYGTLKEQDAQREAAGLLQRTIARRWYNLDVKIKADRDVTEADIKNHHLLLIGRPDSNMVAARMAKSLPVTFGSASFSVRDETYAHPASAVIVAGSNPENPRYSVVLYGGLSAEATWHSVQRLPEEDFPSGLPIADVLLMAAGEKPKALTSSAPEK